MGKLRVHELAKRLNLSNQEVIAKLNARGVIVRTHSSSVDEAAAFKALGLSKTGETSKEIRPRTVLRKRKDLPEEHALGGSEEFTGPDTEEEVVHVEPTFHEDKEIESEPIVVVPSAASEPRETSAEPSPTIKEDA